MNPSQLNLRWGNIIIALFTGVILAYGSIHFSIFWTELLGITVGYGVGKMLAVNVCFVLGYMVVSLIIQNFYTLMSLSVIVLSIFGLFDDSFFLISLTPVMILMLLIDKFILRKLYLKFTSG
jgi:hypothetical protein